MYEDDKSGIYNIHLCRICQNPKKLDLVQSSDASESADGLSCWETLKYIFCEIIWVEDRLLSLICKNCVKNVYETARFKKVCLETNRQRDKFNNSYIELVNEPICNEKQTETDIFHETHEIEVGKPTKIEEVIVPSNEKIEMFLKSENMDDYEASSENMLEDLKVIDVPSAMADVKENDILPPVPKLKRALEKVTPPRRDPVIIKKIKKCNTIPNNVTIISSQLSEFMPYTNPRSNDTICKICQSIFATSIELREHVNSQHTMMPRDQDESNDCIETEARANNAVPSQLPEKSKKRYKMIYSAFKKWCEVRCICETTEASVMEYFFQRSERLKSPTSLWSEYSMLRTTMLVNDQLDIAQYPKVRSFLKMKNKGYHPKKSRVFSKEDIDRFLSDAPDEKYLLLKVTLIVGIAGACHKDELCRLSIDDIEDQNDTIIIRIPDAKGNVQRTFTISDSTDDQVQFLQVFRKYAELRPKDTEHRRFFMRYQAGKCINQVIGTNTFAKMPSQVAKYLNLYNPTDFTGYCFRRSSASLFSNAERQIFGLRRYGEWKLPGNKL